MRRRSTRIATISAMMHERRALSCFTWMARSAIREACRRTPRHRRCFRLDRLAEWKIALAFRDTAQQRGDLAFLRLG